MTYLSSSKILKTFNKGKNQWSFSLNAARKPDLLLASAFAWADLEIQHQERRIYMAIVEKWACR